MSFYNLEPPMNKVIRIGERGSRLARWQAAVDKIKIKNVQPLLH